MTENLSNLRPLLELRHITKEFPSVRALDDVTLDIRAGEVLALIGENGAGKSTLLRILSGDHQPDAGEVRFEGDAVRFASPSDAHRTGVRVIYQEPEIVPGVIVAENLYLGELPRRFGRFVDWNYLIQEARTQIARFGFDDLLSPTELSENLSPAQRQLVEILKALKGGVRVLALDEPTSSLTDEEADRLFEIVDRLRREGVAIIYVSHRLREIFRLADRIAVLRDGQLVGVRHVQETNEDEMVRLMVGRDLGAVFDRAWHTVPEAVLRVEGLSTATVHDVTFEVRRGEVLGLAGLIGAGRTDLAKAIFGDMPLKKGRIYLEGQEISIRNPRDAIKAGIGFAPEDRRGEALLLVRSIRENASMVILDRIRRLRFLRLAKEQQITSAIVEQLQVKTPSIDQEVGKLSGGNQQKVVLARWLARKPRVLILDEPTRGVDVGAKAEIYRLIEQLAAEGVAIIFISSEMLEILGVSDRILVMQSGRVTGELAAGEATEEAVLTLAMSDHLSAESELIGVQA